ncbi:CAP domain-containing protein [Aquimarina sp. AU58]|uniref:CAP domain-containing protein n=1 Tax=Aquimarina sp. AU58 TaxID=1874112 RepID=UPI000D6E116E|nr:CAP domain-containing protein [Aquimarina sp. AU58]
MKTSLIKYFCVFVLLCTAFSCSKDDDDNTITETPSEVSITDEILKLVNEYRQTKGLEALAKNTTAEELAADHTRYMISKGTINHDNFDAKFDTLREKENATGMAENVASFYPDAQSVVDGWINSEGHRKNIEGNYTHTGIAAIKDESGRYYYTQIFYR